MGINISQAYIIIFLVCHKLNQQLPFLPHRKFVFSFEKLESSWNKNSSGMRVANININLRKEMQLSPDNQIKWWRASTHYLKCKKELAKNCWDSGKFSLNTDRSGTSANPRLSCDTTTVTTSPKQVIWHSYKYMCRSNSKLPLSN